MVIRCFRFVFKTQNCPVLINMFIHFFHTPTLSMHHEVSSCATYYRRAFWKSNRGISLKLMFTAKSRIDPWQTEL